jgi:hypothetical protein
MTTGGGFCTKVWNDQKAMKPRVLSSCPPFLLAIWNHSQDTIA